MRSNQHFPSSHSSPTLDHSSSSRALSRLFLGTLASTGALSPFPRHSHLKQGTLYLTRGTLTLSWVLAPVFGWRVRLFAARLAALAFTALFGIALVMPAPLLSRFPEFTV